MDFEHNAEREAYIKARGKIVLNACPGSGKTTTIAYKLTQLTENWDDTHGGFVGVACLSFTNVAKDEINAKYSSFSGKAISFPHIVSTIDSFINQYITLPFYYLFRKDFPARPRILDDAVFMDDWHFNHSISVQNRSGKTTKKLLKYSYPPSTIDSNLDGSFSSDAKRPSLIGESLSCFNRYCIALKSIQYSKGLLKNSDSTCVALSLLREYPRIAALLVSRFPHIIIDEAQDTSEIQYAIADELIKSGLQNIELVGDPYQSLYEWRDARPDLFWERYSSAAWQSLPLNNCRRSTQNIVNCYSVLRRACDAQLTSTLVVERQEPVTVLFYDDPVSLLERYKNLSCNYGDCRVLVRGGTHLDAFGAKPSHESMWNIKPCFPHHLILSYFELEDGQIRDAIRRIRRCLPILIEPGSDIERQKELLESMRADPTWNARIMRMIYALPSLALTVAEWTDQIQTVVHSCLMLKTVPDFSLKQGTMRSKHNCPMRNLYHNAPNSSLVTTIHQAKGKTFDSVMLVLSKSNAGQNICQSNIERPTDLPDEKKRLIYVAMSRPRYQLAIAIPKEAECTRESIRATLGPSIAIEDL